MDRDRLREEARLAGIRWAKANAIADRLEDQKKIQFAKVKDAISKANPSWPINKIESQVYLSPSYAAFLDEMHKAREEANLAMEERLDAQRKYFDAKTAEANQREEMRLAR